MIFSDFISFIEKNTISYLYTEKIPEVNIKENIYDLVDDGFIILDRCTAEYLDKQVFDKNDIIIKPKLYTFKYMDENDNSI